MNSPLLVPSPSPVAGFTTARPRKKGVGISITDAIDAQLVAWLGPDHPTRGAVVSAMVRDLAALGWVPGSTLTRQRAKQ